MLCGVVLCGVVFFVVFFSVPFFLSLFPFPFFLSLFPVSFPFFLSFFPFPFFARGSSGTVACHRSNLSLSCTLGCFSRSLSPSRPGRYHQVAARRQSKQEGVDYNLAFDAGGLEPS